MNLQEQLNRIQEMMGNNDYSKQLNKLQKIIDRTILLITEKCKIQDSHSEEIITFDACDFIEYYLKNVKVVDFNVIDGNPIISINIYYESIFPSSECETFTYELEWNLKKVMSNVKIKIVDCINKKTNNDW